MTPEEAVAEVNSAFPHGARVVSDGPRGTTIDLVGLEAKSGPSNGEDLGPTLLGWAYPNKDRYFSLEKVEERPDGWLITDQGQRYLFKPLTKKQGDALSSRIEEST